MITKTLADVAEAAGVSTAPVSRVMNQKPGVKEATRENVLRALEAAGYEAPSKLATDVVAILIPELSNPVFPQYAQELSLVLYDAGYSAIVCPVSQGGYSEVQYLDTLLSSHVSGIISVSGTAADSLASKTPYRKLTDERVPAVYINGFTHDIPAPFFNADDCTGIELAVDHLRELGHRRIGLAVGQPRYLPTTRKSEAFLNLGFDETDIEYTEYTADGGARAGRRLLASDHTAIICGSDVMALGLMQEASRQGLVAPKDFSVIGYDDSPVTHLTNLTTVRQPVNTISEAAVGTLLAMLRGDEVPASERLFAPDLTLRDTTGAL